MLDRENFTDGRRVAVTFDLSNEKSIKAEIVALPGNAAELSYLDLPFGIKNETMDERHVIFVWKHRRETIFSYNMRPSRTASLLLASFDPVFSENSAMDALIRDADVSDRDSNLYFIQEGLQRLFQLRLPPSRKIELEGGIGGGIEVANPDLVAVRLPSKFKGRTFSSGRMYEPEPLPHNPSNDLSLLIFPATNTNSLSQIFRVTYELPQPDWVSIAVRIGLKFLGLILPIVLIAWTDPEKVNPRRFRHWSIAIGTLYLVVYGFLIYLTISTSGSLEAIIEDAGFAALTAVVAVITYRIKSKTPVESTVTQRPAVL